jgi:preprotein translocase subunit SecE
MTTGAAIKPSGNRFTRFFSGIWGELRKVVWLTRKEVIYLTTMVLIVSIVAGVVLWAFDLGFSQVIERFVIQK